MVKYKYEEWQDVIGKLNDKVFEELCYRLVTRLGYEKVRPRGGSSDGGRDLEGEKTRLEGDNRTTYIEKYWFECKCYTSGTIPWKEISDKLHSAGISRVDKFVILSNQGLSPQAQDKVKEYEQQTKVRVTQWCGFPFLDLLFQFKDLCDTYFPEIETPEQVPGKSAEEHVFQTSISLAEGLGVNIESKTKLDINPENIGGIIASLLRTADYSKLANNAKEKAIIYNNVSMIFRQFGFLDDALTFIDSAIRLDPNEYCLLNKGVILEQLNSVDDSSKIYKNLLKKNPKNVSALNNLGHNFVSRYKLNQALELFDKALIIEPHHLSLLNNKAQTLKRLKRFDEAIKFVNLQIEFNSSLVLQKTKVDILTEALDLKEAYRLVKQLQVLYPSDADLINGEGVIYEHNSNFQNRQKYLSLAYESFGRARNANPRLLLAIGNQAVCLAKQSRPEEAEILVNEGLSHDADDPYLLSEKAKIELTKGNGRLALIYIERALKKSYLEKSLVIKCQVLAALKKYSDLKKLCEVMLEIDPNNAEILRFYAQAVGHEHKPQKAKLILKKAASYTINPRSLLE